MPVPGASTPPGLVAASMSLTRRSCTVEWRVKTMARKLGSEARSAPRSSMSTRNLVRFVSGSYLMTISGFSAAIPRAAWALN